MITIGKMTNIREVASFISALNQQAHHHVGFCGEQEEEIEETLMNEFSELALNDSVFVAYRNNEILGVIGFDVDIEKRQAEVWGPFIKDEQDWLTIAIPLWNTGVKTIKHHVDTLFGFYNVKHRYAKQLMEKVNGINKGNHIVLCAHRSASTSRLTNNDYFELIPELYSSFITLHDAAFPNTYYAGQEIIARLDSDNRVYIAVTSDRKLQGYCYVISDPEFQEGTIEFIAVSPEYRKQGIGADLIKRALDYLFIEKRIEETTLCVASDNVQAVHVYLKAGFVLKHDLASYRIELERISS
ncbi:GNAT family N-acetyltransferase [Paenibacillus albiflavus]|uniref:GNAT family N-acetyltransferase n=1 Tax=Paenibacillus albiflavus TaxID=2545760 RepID=A0A4V2WP37_9BACL|nr:GNAT family N-acetyltransferase [Paenibacillus albiflavus]TCZ77852.1 GNAT family N-acetyltransferase [Paenibacillus albiflavus]